MISAPNARRRSLLTAALAVVLLAVLAAAPSGAAPAQVVPGDDWQVDTPESHGIDPALLDAARAYAFLPGKNTQGLVVVHEGAIVGEWYAPGEGPDSWAASWSVAKSFTSALIGIAIDEGHIASVDDPMTTWYPEWAGTPKAAITLLDVLHMESGLAWVEDYSPTSTGSDVITMLLQNRDQLAYAASRPLEDPPGTDFSYSSGDTMLLSGVLERATGMPAHEYARTRLFEPLGMDQVEWWQDAEGHTLTYCCLDTTGRDFARFGLLYLLGGSWGGDQVVPASWVTDSVTDTANTSADYGYQWWLRDGDGFVPPYYSARGHDGQYIYVVPSLDLVVVRNGTYDKSPCPAVADPNLFVYYPPQGIVPGAGTVGPESGWSDTEVLTPIVAAITGDPLPPDGALADDARLVDGVGQRRDAHDLTAACENVAPTTTTTAPAAAPAAVTTSPAAVPASARPTFTG